MKAFHRLSLVDQTAEHLRERARSGQWREKLPGVQRLCEELNVSEATMRSALRKLEAEGLLVSGGHCRSRRVAPQPGGGRGRKSMTVGILPHDARPGGHPKSWPGYLDPVTLEIQHALEAAGHTVIYSGKSQVDLGHSVTRIRQEIAKHPVGAWIVLAGSRQLLEWFAGQPIPSIAVYGRTDGLEMARTGPDHLPATLAATRELIALGHRRIVRWVAAARRGRADRAQINFPATFIAGGSIGPADRGSGKK